MLLHVQLNDAHYLASGQVGGSTGETSGVTTFRVFNYGRCRITVYHVLTRMNP